MHRGQGGRGPYAGRGAEQCSPGGGWAVWSVMEREGGKGPCTGGMPYAGRGTGQCVWFWMEREGERQGGALS